MIGSSLGGGGAWAFAQRMATKPMIGYLGTIALSPVMRLLSLAQDTAVFPMLILLLVPRLIANFPDLEAEALLTPIGMQCLENLPHAPRLQQRAIQTASVPNMLEPGWQHNIHLHQYQEIIAANGRREIRGLLPARDTRDRRSHSLCPINHRRYYRDGKKSSPHPRSITTSFHTSPTHLQCMPASTSIWDGSRQDLSGSLRHRATGAVLRNRYGLVWYSKQKRIGSFGNRRSPGRLFELCCLGAMLQPMSTGSASWGAITGLGP